jgi:hypothetical protein
VAPDIANNSEAHTAIAIIDTERPVKRFLCTRRMNSPPHQYEFIGTSAELLCASYLVRTSSMISISLLPFGSDPYCVNLTSGARQEEDGRRSSKDSPAMLLLAGWVIG